MKSRMFTSQAEGGGWRGGQTLFYKAGIITVEGTPPTEAMDNDISTMYDTQRYGENPFACFLYIFCRGAAAAIHFVTGHTMVGISESYPTLASSDVLDCGVIS